MGVGVRVDVVVSFVFCWWVVFGVVLLARVLLWMVLICGERVVFCWVGVDVTVRVVNVLSCMLLGGGLDLWVLGLLHVGWGSLVVNWYCMFS